jgi:hypothetical protein
MRFVRRALLVWRGDPTVFLRQPISLAFMVTTVLILLSMATPAVDNISVAMRYHGGLLTISPVGAPMTMKEDDIIWT